MSLLDGIDHLNAQRLNVFNDTIESGMEYSGTLSPCNIRSMDKEKERNHPP